MLSPYAELTALVQEVHDPVGQDVPVARVRELLATTIRATHALIYEGVEGGPIPGQPTKQALRLALIDLENAR